MAGAVEPASLRRVRLPPPLLAFALIAMALAMHALVLGRAAPLGRSPIGGTVLALAGFGWMLWAAWLLRREGTTIRPAGQPTVLIEEGPYRFGRHPMYLGMAAAMLGLALALGVPLLAAGAVAFVVVVRRVHIPFEEARLQRTFGGWYSDYAAHVRRWF